MGYIAREGVTYLVGGITGGTETSVQYVGSSDVPVGTQTQVTTYTYAATSGNEPTIISRDTPASYVQLGTNLVGSVSDRTPNEPSGYNSLGVATYGDGKINAVTTWATDNSKLDPSVAYFGGASGHIADYDAFAT